MATGLGGRREDYAIADGNPAFELYGADYINHPAVIAQNDNMVAINTAFAVDIYGQIITEHGGASLRGASRRRRAEALVSIAHPDVHAELERQMRGVFWSTPSGPVSDAGGAQ